MNTCESFKNGCIEQQYQHLPVKVNNYVKRRQENANITSKWSVFNLFKQNFKNKHFIQKRNLCYVAFQEDDIT